MNASIAVAIVSYRTSKMVLESLPALMAELASFDEFHVAIVDNASPDEDGAALKAGVEAMDLGERVEVILSDVNGGFAAGNNIAFARFRQLPWRPDYAMLLNPDARLRPGVLGELKSVMDAQPRAGFVGPRLADPDGSIWIGAFNFPSFGTEVLGAVSIPFISNRFSILAPESDAPQRVDWVSGAAPLIRWEMIDELGDMDEGYFLYYEEVDYMRHAGRLGWQCWHAPRAVVDHIGGGATQVVNGRGTSGRTPGYWFESWGRYFSKNHGPANARMIAICKVLAMLFANLHRRVRGKPNSEQPSFIVDFLKNIVIGKLSPPPLSTRARGRGLSMAPDTADVRPQ